MQHGFFSKRSTLSNLTEFSDIAFKTVDNNGQMECIYTDFSKAFDKVCHSILLHKLEAFDIPPILLNWFQSYLNNRIQVVRLNGILSDSFDAPSGVPQGSILGPLLFIIFINDISGVIKSNYLLYADDLKIFKVINTAYDFDVLQGDLNSVYDWCTANQLPLNLSKCVSMSYTKKINKMDYSFNIGGTTLSRIDTVKDLGIVFDSKLRFDIHFDLMCRKSCKLLGFIFRRGRDFKDPSSLVLLFTSIIRTNLEYLSQVWNPYYDDYSNRIESVQRRFTKFLCFRYVPSTKHMCYEIRCGKFNLISLENRRVLLDEYLLFKIINNLLDTTLLSKINFYAPAYMTRHQQLFQPSSARTNLGLSSPVNRLEANHMLYFRDLDLFGTSLSQFKTNCNVALRSYSDSII